MAENYGSLTGTLDTHDTIEGNLDNHGEMSGEMQFGGGGGGVLDVFQNGQSVVEGRKAYVTVPTLLRELRSDDYHNTVTAFEMQIWNGKADPSDIPTALSQLDNDANFVQDADYVHTDNNFTDEDKAAIGGIPENITDLSDVEISNIQNGQVLKWDSNQNKFVNANESGGGSGDVADVKVNGTSVVDPVTKEANIDLTGYAETSDIPTDLADLSDDATHRLVTDTEKSTWDNKADVSDIPTVNNNTITIQKNGQNVDSFTLNQNSNKAINIAVPTKTSDLQNDDSFITNTVNNLANYYLKSDTYTQTEVNNLISAAVNGRFEKVTTLPASGEPNVIYLVPKTTALTNNVYDEYIWQDNAWELLGSTEIDLSNYVTTTDLSTALADYVTSSTFNTTIANYYTKTEVGNLLDNKVDKVSGKGLSTYDYDATAKGIVDNVTTNLAGKVDKVNGKGLSTEDYTTNEKNKLSGIASGAEVNVQSDFSQTDTSADDFIKNKPTKVSDFTNDSGFTKVESSTTNGNIKIDGTETQVYDDSEIQDKIDETTTSISGNPISISGLKSTQLAVDPVITFEPIQDLHGQSKPYPAGGGKNLYGNGNVNGTGYVDVALVKPLGAGTYTLSAIVTSSDTDSAGCLLFDVTNDVALANIARNSSSRTRITITISATCSTLRFYAATSYQYCLGDTFSFTDIQIESGSTATPYAPYENICPISGYDKIEVLSCGKNLFNPDSILIGSISNNVWTYPNSTAKALTCSFLSNTQYTFSGYVTQSAANVNVRLRVFYTDGTFDNIFFISTTTKTAFTYTSIASKTIDYIGAYYGATGTCSIENFQIEEGQTATTYEPCNKTTDLSESLGQTVYGATWYLRTGVLKSKEKANYIVIDGDANWQMQTSGSNKRFYVTGVGVNINESSTDHICNMALVASGNNASQCYTVDDRFALYTASNGTIYLSGNIASDVTALKALLNTTPLQICYTVVDSAEKTIQLTPHEISLLKDYAYVSTNGTNIAFDYHNGEMASLADVSQLGETVNELGEYVNTINDNEYVDCNNCSTIASIFDTIKQGQALKSISYGVGYIGNSQNTNIKTLLGNPSIANYVDVYIKPIATATYVQLAEVFAIGTVNVQTPIKRKYIWTNQSMASQSAWETINYMT